MHLTGKTTDLRESAIDLCKIGCEILSADHEFNSFTG